ncbi:class I SAM-dependent methyltransferase [Fusobacterium animalis]|uniref:class I SAM-dependent methyltransferase n=1 Tax=Fusobacterium animalis TaxID=76859 RepID=UPI0034E02EF6
MTKKILDVCCGSKMFWFDKDRTDTVYMDNRELEDVLCDGRKLEIKPDIVADFRNIPFPDKTFKLVVFDPPHLQRVGEKSWLAKKYDHLGNNWKEDLKKGFKECFRVLEYYGVLIFKWNEEQIKLSEILKLTDVKPLFGNRRAKTHWLVFIKEDAMIEYLQELRVRDGNQVRIINSHIFKEKYMTEDEIEAKKIEFSKNMKEIYFSDGKELEIIDNIITEVR